MQILFFLQKNLCSSGLKILCLSIKQHFRIFYIPAYLRLVDLFYPKKYIQIAHYCAFINLFLHI